MSMDQREDELPPPAPTAATPIDPVLAGYTKRMHRLSLWYGAVVAVIAVVVIAWVAVVMSHSEIAHAKLVTATTIPPDVAQQSPSPTPELAWTNPDRLAIGSPLIRGTVITYSTHTVTGRNALTGAPTWTYTRTDLSICEVVQEQGFTVAFFNRAGNCDEVNAFNSESGKRAWSRTLDSDGKPIDGIPTFAANQYTITLTTPKRVQAIEPSGDSSQGGLDRWNTQAPSGCQNVSSALGTNGVLIMQDCTDGKYLQLRDAYAADQIDNKPNPKLQLWRVRVAGDFVPVSADTLISAYDPASGNLNVYTANGSVGSTIVLASHPSSTAKSLASVTDGGELIWIDGHGYSISTSTLAVTWTTPLAGPASPASSGLVAAVTDGVAALTTDTGQLTATYPLPSPPQGSLAVPLGSGFLIGRSGAGGDVTKVYK